jgi:hypothetical protein
MKKSIVNLENRIRVLEEERQSEYVLMKDEFARTFKSPNHSNSIKKGREDISGS